MQDLGEFDLADENFLDVQTITDAMMTTAQSLADAVIMSLAGMTGLLYSGYVIDNLGLRTLMFIGMGIFIIPVFIVIRGLLRKKL